MGHMRAIDAATTMTDMAGLERALGYHLTANHFPPVPKEMVPVCIEAIRIAVEADESDDLNEWIELPGGITYKGMTESPAWAVIEAHHLGPFIDAELERRREGR